VSIGSHLTTTSRSTPCNTRLTRHTLDRGLSLSSSAASQSTRARASDHWRAEYPAPAAYFATTRFSVGGTSTPKPTPAYAGPVSRDLSIAIVCKDNADTIGSVLDSVAGLASEIVAVDSGSTDGTIPMLDRAGARVIRSDWLGHVKTKQKALEACARAWVLCLDSDEPVTPGLRVSIEATVDANDPGVAGARVNRKVWYCPGERGGSPEKGGRWLHHAWQPERTSASSGVTGPGGRGWTRTTTSRSRARGV